MKKLASRVDRSSDCLLRFVVVVCFTLLSCRPRHHHHHHVSGVVGRRVTSHVVVNISLGRLDGRRRHDACVESHLAVWGLTRIRI